MTAAPHFRRYTGLGALIHILQSRHITLLNPASWDDGNDAYFMSEYKRLKSLKTVLALCLTQSSETYHHWKVFSAGPDGVCIEFKKDRLVSGLTRHLGITSREVRYWTIENLKAEKTIPLDDLPFIKRYPYQDEQEFRFVFESSSVAKEFADFAIEINWIARVTLSPWMSSALRDSVKSTLRAIPGCDKIYVSRSTLIGNADWQALVAKAK